MAYLKALGILRLVSEQVDARARGWWRDDVFWLRSSVLFEGASTDEERRNSLVGFFLGDSRDPRREKYRPTPIVAPWAGGSGFFKRDNKKAVEALRNSSESRVSAYADVIRSVRAIVNEEKVGDKPKDDDKSRLIRRFRREMPDGVVAWIDAAMVVQHGGQDFAPLLGTGGNDGRLDFTQNFMQRVVLLGLNTTDPVSDRSRSWLANALFAKSTQLDSASVGQFAPGRAGGPNASQGMEGASADNPWDFILMLEGVLMLAGAAARRFGIAESARAAFPFTVRTVAAGFDSSGAPDGAVSRGELWLPLWDRPASAVELRYLFGEGRADVSGRPARDGTDFARAVAGLGVDRGIAEFARLGFLKRSGKAFLATPLARFVVTERGPVELFRQVDPWLSRFRSICTLKDTPPRFGRALRSIDSAVLNFCRYGGNSFFQQVLVTLGRAEREVASAERLRRDKELLPIAGLSKGWRDAASDDSPEFAVALGLAFVHDPEANVGPLRCNLEAVDWKRRCRSWAEKDRSVAWSAADLPTNLANVLQRRLMDAERAGCERLPLKSHFNAPLGAVAAFIQDDLYDERIEDLIWGLMLVDRPRKLDEGARYGAAEVGDPPLPREYALLKLLFLPSPLVPERWADGIRWRLARSGEQGVAIRPDSRVLSLLRSGRVGEACGIATQRLRASGLAPMPGPLASGPMRDGEWSELSSEYRRAQRLAAALLIPISSASVDRLVRLACRDQPAAVEALAVATQGGTK